VRVFLIASLALFALGAASFAATPKKKPAHTAVRHSPARKTVVATKSKSRRPTAAPRTYRSYQAAPTRERYAQIQQALHDKGFFNGEANGTWGSDSIDALRRFQSAQNLEPDGKIGSLSLIALGLGPKRLTAQAKPDQAKPADTQSKQQQ